MVNHAEGYTDVVVESEQGLAEPRIVQEGDDAKRILTFYSKPDLIYTRYPRQDGPMRETHDENRP